MPPRKESVEAASQAEEGQQEELMEEQARPPGRGRGDFRVLRKESIAAQAEEESLIGDSAQGAATAPGAKRVGASAAEAKLVGASLATIG